MNLNFSWLKSWVCSASQQCKFTSVLLNTGLPVTNKGATNTSKIKNSSKWVAMTAYVPLWGAPFWNKSSVSPVSISILNLTKNIYFFLYGATFIWPWKINVKTERKQKCKTLNSLIEQKQTSANFHWLSEDGCKQRHLSRELSRKFRTDAFEIIGRNVIGHSNCLLPILGDSLAGIGRKFVLILPNIGPWNKLRTLFQVHTKVALFCNTYITLHIFAFQTLHYRDPPKGFGEKGTWLTVIWTGEQGNKNNLKQF